MISAPKMAEAQIGYDVGEIGLREEQAAEVLEAASAWRSAAG